jgi:hypothetical protein
MLIQLLRIVFPIAPQSMLTISPTNVSPHAALLTTKIPQLSSASFSARPILRSISKLSKEPIEDVIQTVLQGLIETSKLYPV